MIKTVLKIIVIVLISIQSTSVFSQIETYTWTIGADKVRLSDKYKVWVKVNSGEEEELQVIKSDPIVTGEGNTRDPYGDTTMERIFSFVNVSFDETAGDILTFRVEKLFGAGASSIEIRPKSYNISGVPSSSGDQVSFQVTSANKSIAVYFKHSDNITSQHNWIKNPLMIFVDPLEKNVPQKTDEGVVVYNDNVDATILKNAKVIYFDPGFYDLTVVSKPGIIMGQGEVNLQDKQTMYIAGGAFVLCHITHTGNGQKLLGRGVLSGRKHVWHSESYFINNLAHLGHNAEIEGIMAMESANHGLVSGQNGTYNNVKYWGWHPNNDGFRPDKGTVIRNCFLHSCDDAFYNKELDIRQCVIWPAWNGSIMTFGWAWRDIGGSHMEDCDVIYTEWPGGLGMNRGLIMSVNTYDFKPTGPTTVFKNIRFEGSIPGFCNLKPNNNAQQLSDPNMLGYLGNILFQDIYIENQWGKNRLQGGANALTTGSGTWYTKDVTFHNIYIDGQCIDDSNKDQYFSIDQATTQNIQFLGCGELFNISASSGANGSISPSDFSFVAEGGSKSYSFIPNTGFRVKEVLIDSISIGAVNSYTFENVDANHTVHVIFEPIPCDLPWDGLAEDLEVSNIMFEWKSDTIEIGCANSVSISVLVSSLEISDQGADNLGMFYTLDGGGEIEIANYSASVNNNAAEGESIIIENVKGKQLQIIVRGKTTAANKKYLVKQIKVDSDFIPFNLVIQAEDYTEMSGIQTQSTSDEHGGENIGFIENGDWSEYSVLIPTSDTYSFIFRVATQRDGGNIEIVQEGEVLASATVDGEKSNGWQDWYNTDPVNVTLNSGEQKIRLNYTGGSGFLFNLNWFKITKSGQNDPTSIIREKVKSPEKDILIYPNPASSVINIVQKDAGSIEVKIFDLNGRLLLSEQGEGNISINNAGILKPGVYIISINKNNSIFNDKLIIR